MHRGNLKKAPDKAPKKKHTRLPLIFAILASFAVIFSLVLFLSAKKDTIAILRTGGKTFPEQFVVATTKPHDNGGFKEDDGAMIESVNLHPDLPTRLDSLRAEVTPLPNTSVDQLKYTYTWKVNERIIKDTTGDELDLSPFRKGDLVSVTVIPYNRGTSGYAVKSPVVAIHSIPPSLEIKVIRKTARIGEPYALQLFSDHPDSETDTFSLEEPKIEGMTIDGQTGKIGWIIQPNQKGTVRFGAAVQDSEGNRITKIFEINMDQTQAAPQSP